MFRFINYTNKTIDKLKRYKTN